MMIEVRNPRNPKIRRGEPAARPRTVSAITFLLLAAALTAQDVRPITLDEAVALTVENHRALDAAQARVEAAEAVLAESRAASGPSAGISGGYAYLSAVDEFSIPAPPPATGTLVLNPSIDHSYQIALSARQPLYTGGRLTSTRDAAQARAYAAREEWASQRADLVLAASRAYWGLSRALEERRVVDDDLALVRAHLADVERFLAEGMATVADRLKVEARLSAVLFRRVASDHAVQTASMALADLAGLPLDAVLEPSTPLPVPAAPPLPARDLAAGALEDRPELRALRLRAEAASAAVGIARAERLPQVALSARYLYGRPNPRIFPSEDRFEDTWDIGLGLSFDLWDGGAAARRMDQAAARVREAEAALALASDAVALEVRGALLALDEALALIGVAETGMRQAEEDLRVTRERFREGLALNTEVLDSEMALLEARLRHTQALAAHAIALAQLDRAVGR